MKLNLSNLKQKINNSAVSRREFQIQYKIESLIPEPRD
jgi:hypothetical protein